MRMILLTSIGSLTAGTMMDWSGISAQLASLAGAVTLWTRRSSREPEPNEELRRLTERLRHPVLSAFGSPIVTIRRKMDRRRSS